MIAALRSEYRKIVTTRTWWVLLLAMLAYMSFLAATFAFAMTQGGAMGGPGTQGLGHSPTSAISVYTIAVAFGYVFPVIVGALSVTGEFRHQTITPTLLAEPRRTTLVGAKLLAAVPVGVLYGVLGTAAGVGVGAGVLALTDHATYLDDPEVLVAVGRSVLALAVWAVVGVGLGLAMPNQVAVIVVVLAFTQFVEPILRFALAFVADGALAGVGAYLPGAAGEAITGSSFYSQMGAGELLAWWQGLLVLVGYALVFAALGRVTTLRRDIT
ncbi:ABC transporter permease [Oerskovia flava]|uniref:ABC transporter permease n=1 Tax=Oerskovia flava TaxID=2986422 RepID=UPI00223F7C81|nr:ABC transporter permease [Oerskovia sp. JB1-3-2]